MPVEIPLSSAAMRTLQNASRQRGLLVPELVHRLLTVLGGDRALLENVLDDDHSTKFFSRARPGAASVCSGTRRQ